MYLFTNHLGSFDRIINESGNVVDVQSFDAWGNRRNYQNWQQHEPLNTKHLFDRGYTGHEHLDTFKIINMNGRLYDPVVARFFSADPFVQAPDYTQNYNRYSYCLNNPVMYTDPSGEIIFTALAAIFCQPLLPLAFAMDAGWMQGGFRAVSEGDNFMSGAWKGALTGTVAGGLGMIGGPSMAFGWDLALSVGQGALTGALDAALWGEKIGKGMLIGGISAGIFTTLTSENMNNFMKGNGFKRNSNVFNNFMSDPDMTYQQILDYFSLDANYSDKYDNDGWYNVKSDKIFIGRGGFEDYNVLKQTYAKETFERSMYKKGKWAMPNNLSGIFGYDILPEELVGHKHIYRNKGLYPNKTNLLQTIGNLERRIIEANELFPNFYKFQKFEKKWWHFIYNTPRRF